ncbi:hypothetical protein C7M84_007538 [Penaeus vannamei]|uniref:Uncharacterized protein n=1 Tax=Penaeus vannamei TaxID=6689 RepID=A0A3R7P2X9_PENVA|nr:hypothetical protein C7M84_007538 [Penaeus vannamei]
MIRVVSVDPDSETVIRGFHERPLKTWGCGLFVSPFLDSRSFFFLYLLSRVSLFVSCSLFRSFSVFFFVSFLRLLLLLFLLSRVFLFPSSSSSSSSFSFLFSFVFLLLSRSSLVRYFFCFCRLFSPLLFFFSFVIFISCLFSCPVLLYFVFLLSSSSSHSPFSLLSLRISRYSLFLFFLPFTSLFLTRYSLLSSLLSCLLPCLLSPFHPIPSLLYLFLSRPFFPFSSLVPFLLLSSPFFRPSPFLSSDPNAYTLKSSITVMCPHYTMPKPLTCPFSPSAHYEQLYHSNTHTHKSNTNPHHTRQNPNHSAHNTNTPHSPFPPFLLPPSPSPLFPSLPTLPLPPPPLPPSPFPPPLPPPHFPPPSIPFPTPSPFPFLPPFPPLPLHPIHLPPPHSPFVGLTPPPPYEKKNPRRDMQMSPDTYIKITEENPIPPPPLPSPSLIPLPPFHSPFPSPLFPPPPMLSTHEANRGQLFVSLTSPLSRWLRSYQEPCRYLLGDWHTRLGVSLRWY